MLVSATGCARLVGMFNNLDTPEIKKIGNVISWTAVEDAKTYEILVDGESYDTTTETNYIFEDVERDINVSVVAYAENTYLKSEETQKIKIYKNSAFMKNETLEIELNDNQEYSIPSSVKNLKILGTAVIAFIIMLTLDTDDLLLSVAISTGIYLISVISTLSPLGEWLLRLRHGCRRIERADHRNRLDPLFREVESRTIGDDNWGRTLFVNFSALSKKE